MSGPRSVSSASAAASSTSVPRVDSTDSFSPSLYKFVFFLLAACILIWLLRLLQQAKRTLDLYRAFQQENVVRVEGAAAAAHLTRDSLLAILRSRSVLSIEAVDKVRIKGHVHPKLCRITRVPVAPAASDAVSALMPSALPAAAVAAGSSPFFDLSLHLSGCSALKVEVYVGVPVRLVQSLYADHARFANRKTTGTATGGGGGGKAKANASLPRHAGSDERKQQTSPTARSSSSPANQIELAILPSSASSPLGGGPACSAAASLDEHAQFLQSYILDSLVADGQYRPLLQPGEFAWKSHALIVQPPPLPPPPAPASPPLPSTEAAVTPDGSASSSSSLFPTPAPATSSATAPAAATPPPQRAAAALGGAALPPFQHILRVAVPVAPLLAVCADVRRILLRGGGGGGGSGSASAVLAYPLLIHVTPIDGFDLAGSPAAAASSSASPKSAAQRKSAAMAAAAAAAAASHVSEITLAELTGVAGAVSGAVPASDALSDADSVLARLKFEQQLLLVCPSGASGKTLGSSSTAASSAASSRVYEMEELYDLHTAVALPPPTSSSSSMGAMMHSATSLSLSPDAAFVSASTAAAAIATEGSNLAIASSTLSASASASATAPPAPSSSSASHDDSNCVACMSAVKDVILLPCRHVCLCGGCFASVTKCPVCRAPIRAHIKFVDEDTHRAKIKRKVLRERGGGGGGGGKGGIKRRTNRTAAAAADAPAASAMPRGI